MVEQEEMKQIYAARGKLIRAGSVVKSKRIIWFCNGSFHSPNVPIVVSEGTRSYYIVNFDDYEVMSY